MVVVLGGYLAAHLYRMRLRYFLIIALVLPILATAQNIIDSRTANVLPLWKKGDRFAYKVTKTERHFNKGTLQELTSSSFHLTFTVKDTTGGLRIDQRMGDFKLLEHTKEEPMTKEEQAMAERMLAMYSAVPVIFTCSRDGSVEALENTEAVVSGTKSFLGEVMGTIPDADTRSLMTTMMDQLITPEAISTSALEYAQNLHMLHGGGYTVAERMSQDIELPNLLGGDPIPGKLTVVMNSLDPTSKRAIFTITMQVDNVKLQTLVKDLVAKFAAAAGKKLDAKTEREMSDAFRNMKMTDTYNITMDLGGANVTQMSYKREVSVGPTRQLTMQEYQLLP